MNNYFNDLIKNFQNEESEKFLLTNETKDFWRKHFPNKLEVNWEEFRVSFSKYLEEELKLKQDIVNESLIFVKYLISSNEKVNCISFGELFNKENQFEALITELSLESNLNALKQENDFESSIKSYFGINEEENKEKAKEKFVESLKKGNKFAQAITYYNGWEVEQNHKKAFELFSKIYLKDRNLNEKETSYSVYFMAMMYQNGEGVEKKYKKCKYTSRNGINKK